MTRRLLYTKRKTRNGLVPASASMLRDHPPPRGALGAEGFPTDIAVGEYWTLSPWERVKPGDRLWCREAWYEDDPDSGWRSPIHMRRSDSRLTLIVTATKVERLQEITESDCIAEGALSRTPRTWFRELWDRLHGPGSWDADPDVVAMTFAVHKQNIDTLEARPVAMGGTE